MERLFHDKIIEGFYATKLTYPSRVVEPYLRKGASIAEAEQHVLDLKAYPEKKNDYNTQKKAYQDDNARLLEQFRINNKTMSRTKTVIEGVEYPKSKKTSRIMPKKNMPKSKFKKHFGFTSGTHSQFDLLTDEQKEGRNYPIKGKDFIKYGYGSGIKKSKKTKNYKKEIE
jgi:hypothetical protein